MTDLFLHHYPASLFSEKIRSLLGYCALEWNSVQINNIMPRPNLMELSGGYRKTPILQDGASVFCDTKIIAQHVASRGNKTSLYAAGFVANRFAEWADTTLFRTAVGLCFQPKAVEVIAAQLGAENLQAFMADRAELSGGQQLASITPALAEASFVHYLRELESSLGQSFLFGDAPSIADFSLYHCLWFVSMNPVVAPLLDDFPRVKAYMQPFIEWGQQPGLDSTSEAALQRGTLAEPELFAYGESLASEGINLGDSVNVTPDDYGRIPVNGELLHLSDVAIVVRRSDPVAGQINAYFPRTGFDVEPG